MFDYSTDDLDVYLYDKEKITKPLLSSFQSRPGTAFRLASAMTLFTHGFEEALALAAIPNLISSISSLREELSEEEKKKRRDEFMRTDPDQDQIGQFMIDSVGKPLPRFLSRVEKIITWDIATKGKEPINKWPGWWIRE